MSGGIDTEGFMRGHGFVVLDPEGMEIQGLEVAEMPSAWLSAWPQRPTEWPKGYYIWALDTPEGPFDSATDAIAARFGYDADDIEQNRVGAEEEPAMFDALEAYEFAVMGARQRAAEPSPNG